MELNDIADGIIEHEKTRGFLDDIGGFIYVD